MAQWQTFFLEAISILIPVFVIFIKQNKKLNLRITALEAQNEGLMARNKQLDSEIKRREERHERRYNELKNRLNEEVDKRKELEEKYEESLKRQAYSRDSF